MSSLWQFAIYSSLTRPRPVSMIDLRLRRVKTVDLVLLVALAVERWVPSSDKSAVLVSRKALKRLDLASHDCKKTCRICSGKETAASLRSSSSIDRFNLNVVSCDCSNSNRSCFPGWAGFSCNSRGWDCPLSPVKGRISDAPGPKPGDGRATLGEPSTLAGPSCSNDS